MKPVTGHPISLKGHEFQLSTLKNMWDNMAKCFKIKSGWEIRFGAERSNTYMSSIA
jgi:hypothetical protein